MSVVVAGSLEEGEVRQLQSAERGRLVRVAYGEDGALRADADEADAEAPPLQDDPSFTCRPPPCLPPYLVPLDSHVRCRCHVSSAVRHMRGGMHNCHVLLMAHMPSTD